jgi:hypothetical protein
VATALSEGESKRKHCIMLEVQGSQVRQVLHCLAGVALCWPIVQGLRTGSFIMPGPLSSLGFCFCSAPLLTTWPSCHNSLLLLPPPSLQWRTVKHPLETVRPFQYASVTLSEQMELDPANTDGVAGGPCSFTARLLCGSAERGWVGGAGLDGADTSHARTQQEFHATRLTRCPIIVPACDCRCLTEFLERKVQSMIDQAERERTAKSPPLPLIRLRVRAVSISGILVLMEPPSIQGCSCTSGAARPLH